MRVLSPIVYQIASTFFLAFQADYGNVVYISITKLLKSGFTLIAPPSETLTHPAMASRHLPGLFRPKFFRNTKFDT